jgi:phosphoglycolate phosphatase-like HAD superfamily hydrolase/transcriptional regulator with XRE-family HTH domain
MKAYQLVIFALEGTILTENHSFYAGVRDLLKKYSFENKYILIQKFHDTPFSLTFSRDIFYKRRKDKYGKAKILTRDEYGYDIPDSDPIDTILKKYELSDESVIYIGSTEEDYEAACSAGVDYAMALWAFPESQHSELKEKYTCCQLDDVYLYVNPDDCENKEKIQSRVSAIKNVISYDRRNVVDNIRYLMDAHYISQNAMAKYLNKDQSSINRMLSGKHDISFETLMLFASVLNVPVEHLLDMPPKRRDHFPCDGFVEYNGKIHRIKSVSDLKKLADELHYITKEGAPLEIYTGKDGK